MKLDTSGFETSMPTIGFGSSNDMLDGFSIVPSFDLPSTTDFDGLQKEAVMVAADSRTLMKAWVLVCFYSLFASSVLCSRSARGYEFGRTYVVRPKGKHQATIVWLHGLGDNGSSLSQLLESMPLPNVRIHINTNIWK
ncbi:unnamed protein product [Brassica oleracea]